MKKNKTSTKEKSAHTNPNDRTNETADTPVSAKGTISCIPSGYIVACIIFILSFPCAIYEITNLDIKCMNDWKALIDSSNIFLSLICISYMVTAFFHKPHCWNMVLVHLLNLVLINKLYLNSTLQEIQTYILKLDPALCLLIGIPTVSFIIIVYQLAKNRKDFLPISPTHNETGSQETTVSTEKSAVKSAPTSAAQRSTNAVSETSHTSDTSNSSTPQKTGKNDDSKTSPDPNSNFGKILPFPISIIIGVCLFCIIWAVINYFMPEPFSNFSSKNKIFLLSALYTLAPICISILLAMFFTFVIYQLFKKAHIQNFLTLQFSALFALVLEFLILYYSEELSKLLVLDQFLNAITDNLFAVVLVLTAIFLILHISCIILINLFFPGKLSDALFNLLIKKVNTIETELIRFSCDFLLGVVNLFQFIPDFFNTIGVVLLDQEELFPTAPNSPSPTEDNPDKNNATEDAACQNSTPKK